MMTTPANNSAFTIGIAPAGNALLLDLEGTRGMNACDAVIESVNTFADQIRRDRNWYVALPPAYAVPAELTDYFAELKSRFRSEGRRLCLHFAEGSPEDFQASEFARETGAEVTAN